MHMLFRIAGVLTLFAFLYLIQDRLKGPVSRMLSLSGKESLVIYVGQGIIIYGAPISGKVLLAILPVYVNPFHIFLLTLSVLGVVYGYAYVWNAYKRNMPKHAEWSLRLSTLIYVLTFLLKKH
jgi:polyferredoxin